MNPAWLPHPYWCSTNPVPSRTQGTHSPETAAALKEKADFRKPCGPHIQGQRFQPLPITSTCNVEYPRAPKCRTEETKHRWSPSLCVNLWAALLCSAYRGLGNPLCFLLWQKNKVTRSFKNMNKVQETENKTAVCTQSPGCPVSCSTCLLPASSVQDVRAFCQQPQVTDPGSLVSHPGSPLEKAETAAYV